REALAAGDELLFQDARRPALDEADVVCVVGTALDFRLRFGRFGEGGKLVHVHGDAAELGRNRTPDACIAADSAAALGILADAVKGAAAGRERWLERLRSAEAAWLAGPEAEVNRAAAPLHHSRLGTELDRVLAPATIVVGDGGDVVAAVSRLLRIHRPGHWLDPGPFGCLGIGPPFALGIGAARAGASIVVVAGGRAVRPDGVEVASLTRPGIPAAFGSGHG